MNLGISMGRSSLPNFINGFGGGFVFVPLTTMAMGLLRKEEMGNAAGIYNLMRNIGGSVGIAVLTANLSRGAQIHQTYLGAQPHARPIPTPWRPRRRLAGRITTVGGSDPVTAAHKALGALYMNLQQQAAMLTYADNFRILAFLSLACIPLVLLLVPASARARHASRSANNTELHRSILRRAPAGR